MVPDVAFSSPSVNACRFCAIEQISKLAKLNPWRAFLFGYTYSTPGMATRVCPRRTLRTARFVAAMACALQGLRFAGLAICRVCVLQGLRFAPWAVAA